MTELQPINTSANSLIRIEKLDHSYGERKVLNQFDLDLQPGEIHALLGPNGSGKSTALGLLSGLIPLQSGNLLLQGARFEPTDRKYLNELGVVFQHPSIDLQITCRQNLELAALLRGMDPSKETARIDQALEEADLRDRANDTASELSGGMRRKLDIARALLHNPRLLILDEPTTGLDEGAFRATWSRIEGARNQIGLTVLLATHRADEGEYCDRISIVSEGRRVITETPDKLRNDVQKDMVIIKGGDPASLSTTIAEGFGVETTVQDDLVMVECSKGHELIPRIVETFPDGRLQTISLRQPTLADVFMKATGQNLGDQERPSHA